MKLPIKQQVTNTYPYFALKIVCFIVNFNLFNAYITQISHKDRFLKI